ncbi:MAG: hypothetical protein O2827_01600 [Verrucomicrobia bacterium]|nr:hypothetical protein [Verrucomicrobiota bacterium]
MQHDREVSMLIALLSTFSIPRKRAHASWHEDKSLDNGSRPLSERESFYVSRLGYAICKREGIPRPPYEDSDTPFTLEYTTSQNEDWRTDWRTLSTSDYEAVTDSITNSVTRNLIIDLRTSPTGFLACRLNNKSIAHTNNTSKNTNNLLR